MNIKHKIIGMSKMNQFKIIERIRITCLVHERERAYAYCDRNNYVITWCGSKIIGYKKLDLSRFALTAERELGRGAA